MKLLSTILGVYVLFLTVAPSIPLTFTFGGTEECETSCCLVEKSTQESECPEDEENETCNMNICNPFMRCCNCYALIMQPQFLPSPLIYLKQRFSAITQFPYSSFLSDAWHPPKIA